MSRAQGIRAVACAALAIGLANAPHVASAKVHQCVDPKTRAVTLSQIECPSDRLPSPAELAASEAAERVRATEAEAETVRLRADAQLLRRFPDAASHGLAQRDELDVVARHIRSTTTRFDELALKRKQLAQEAEFHRGQPLPAVLQRQLDANDGSFNGLTEVFRADEATVHAIVARYQSERAHLEALWSGTGRPERREAPKMAR